MIRESEKDDLQYWQQFEIFMPEGYTLSGFSLKHSAVFSANNKPSINLNQYYVDLIKNVIACSRFDSKIEIKD